MAGRLRPTLCLQILDVHAFSWFQDSAVAPLAKHLLLRLLLLLLLLAAAAAAAVDDDGDDDNDDDDNREAYRYTKYMSGQHNQV